LGLTAGTSFSIAPPDRLLVNAGKCQQYL
jgi:hypothetical protein